MKEDKQEVKSKISEMIGDFSNLLEKTAHTLVDTGDKAKNQFNTVFKKAKEDIEEVIDYLNNDSVNKEELKDGDLVIPLSNIVIPEGAPGRGLYDNGVMHKKGDIFEYNETRDSQYIKTLLKPTTKQAASYGALQELIRLEKLYHAGTKDLNNEIVHRINFHYGIDTRN